MNAESLIPVNADTLLALIQHLRGTDSNLSLGEAAALAIRAWLADGARAPDAPAADALHANAPAADASADGPPALCSRCANERAHEAPAHKQLAANAFAEDELSDRIGTAAGAREPSAYGSARACRGYQWKELFLPDGTDVRMHCDGEVHQARVSGDCIIYQGRRVSPRQFTLVVAGDGRNAWRDLSLRLPGEKRFQRASLLRHRARAAAKDHEPATPDSPAATIAAAAASMSEALRTALQLVEHSNAGSLPKYERRLVSHRRGSDVLAGHAAFD